MLTHLTLIIPAYEILLIFFNISGVKPLWPLTKSYDDLLLGTYLFSIQWISLEHFGKVTIKKEQNSYTIAGQQRSKENSDIVTIKGTLNPITAHHLQFEGSIITKLEERGPVSCIRKGTYNFKVKGTRGYWRLEEMISPCNSGADYIDIYFK